MADEDDNADDTPDEPRGASPTWEEFDALKEQVDRLDELLSNIEIAGGEVTRSDGNIMIEPTQPVDDEDEVLSDGGGGGGGGASLRRIPFSFTAAGDVPTSAELATGIVAGYATASTTPISGRDFLRSDSLNYLVFDTGSSNDVFEFSFVVSSVTYWAVNVGPNRFY